MIDDAFGSMDEAKSEVMRERVWKWFTGTIYNRLMPNGAIVIIGHRLHEDDLQGRLIEQMKVGGDYADQWEIIKLPAVAEAPSEFNDWVEDPLGREPGEALWPAWYPIEALERIRRNIAFPRYWSGLYASRRASPHAMQGSLPAGWLTFTGRELNPLDRNERFQNFIFVLLS